MLQDYAQGHLRPSLQCELVCAVDTDRSTNRVVRLSAARDLRMQCIDDPYVANRCYVLPATWIYQLHGTKIKPTSF
jgi:endonuclease YncB( thermonuclease family)